MLALNEVHEGDCLELLPNLSDNSIDLILTDPPYNIRKAEWDNFGKPAAFLAWLDKVLEQYQRILKPNGSLYLFASPRMAARVEVLVGERFNVLSSITWAKWNEPGYDGWKQKTSKESLRQFYPASERIIFAEHYGADNIAKGEAGYNAKCDELRGFVFEPLRAYLDGEKERAGFTTRQVAEAFQRKSGSRTVTGMAGHWFTSVQWALPTAENYQWLRDLFNSQGGDYLRREHENLRREYENLRREYENLRREYENLRRPFAVTPDVPYTDVWTFPTVKTYPGKHPCEKPVELLEHIIQASSRPGAVVLDSFCGSGNTGRAAQKLGRDFILMDKDPHWASVARQRCKADLDALPLFATAAD